MATISIIIPVYRVEDYLYRCLDSVLSQTFFDFDVILIDDGSPDDSGSICDRYAEQDKRIVVIHQKNKGQATARNVGLKWSFDNSDSKWITFVDSDDWIDKHYLEYLYLTAVNLNTNISACSFVRAKTIDDTVYDNSTFFPKLVDPFYVYTLGGARIEGSVWAKLYKKDLWKDVSFPDGRKWEDLSTLHKVLFKEEKVAWVSNRLYYYYDNPESTVNKKWNLDYIWAWDVLMNDPIIVRSSELYELVCKRGVTNTAASLEYLKEIKDIDKTVRKKDISYLRQKLHEFIQKYRKATGSSFLDCSYYYETLYPRLMWCVWTGVGISRRIVSVFIGKNNK